MWQGHPALSGFRCYPVCPAPICLSAAIPTEELLPPTSSAAQPVRESAWPKPRGPQSDRPKAKATFTVHPLEGERVLLVQATHVSHFLTEVLERCHGVHAGNQNVPGTEKTGISVTKITPEPDQTLLS